MSSPVPDLNSLVLYKHRAAQVRETGSKRIQIQLDDGSQLSVRPKDVTVLHPGPISGLGDLGKNPPQIDDLMLAWELLAGSQTNLRDLVELAYGDFTPAAAWTVWETVADGLYFSGEPQSITVHTARSVQKEEEARLARENERKQWQEFIGRIEGASFVESDSQYLQEVEQLALGNLDQSKVMRDLGKEQTAENAHDLLLQIGYWTPEKNPYPSRAGLILTSAQANLPQLPAEPRRDLTHLLSLAIDDEGNQDPDDALSWEDGRLWVHIADAAALVEPDSALDLEARARAANLYLPEKTVTMLPPEMTHRLALGLEETSPALSFGIDVTPEGQIENLEIIPSWVRVTRWTYEQAEQRLNEPLPAQLQRLANVYQLRRQRLDSVEIVLPEVRVRVDEAAAVSVRPILPLQSRDFVREAMLMAGEAIAAFADENDIPLPYAIQDPPGAELPAGQTMSTMFARRKLLKPGRHSTAAALHSGLGMERYVQATSPLRRYLDLVVHQQIRAHLGARTLLSEQDIVARIGATDAVRRDLRRAERLARKHWTLVYLSQNPDWQGNGIVVENHGRRSVVVIPELDLETDIYLADQLPLDSELRLEVREINLASLVARFKPA